DDAVEPGRGALERRPAARVDDERPAAVRERPRERQPKAPRSSGEDPYRHTSSVRRSRYGPLPGIGPSTLDLEQDAAGGLLGATLPDEIASLVQVDAVIPGDEGGDLARVPGALQLLCAPPVDLGGPLVGAGRLAVQPAIECDAE